MYDLPFSDDIVVSDDFQRPHIDSDRCVVVSKIGSTVANTRNNSMTVILDLSSTPYQKIRLISIARNLMSA